MKNKRAALIFNWTLTFMVIGILAWASLQFASKYSKFEPFGTKQLAIFKTYSKAESTLFYVDQSAKYSAYQTIYDLASNGGYHDEPDCGSYQGAITWIVIKKVNSELKADECSPDIKTLKENFINFYSENLGSYFVGYQDTYIPGTYDYDLNGNLEITGKAIDTVVFNIIPEKYSAINRQTASNAAQTNAQSTNSQIPQILRVPMRSNPDVETIKQYHPEVWTKYAELCRAMGSSDASGNPPGICKSAPVKCCITSGYRHPLYNAEIGGAANSPHQYGVALDIYTGRDVNKQLEWVKQASNFFTRVGVYPTQDDIHVDLMPPKGEYAATYWIGKKGKTIATAGSIEELQKKASAFT